MPSLGFTKYEGLGNDFVVLDVDDPSAFGTALAPALCDRRFGVGADGVILVSPPEGKGARARMRVINADGSVPEMCGNGLRCVALHLARSATRGDGAIVVETDAGARLCRVTPRGPLEASVAVDMGVVRVTGARTLSLARGEVEVEVALVDAGNPHAVVVRCDPAAGIDELGPAISAHPDFPRGVNVELMTAREGALEVVVWERGVGRTLACGTGACAVVAHACAHGVVRSGARVTVRLPGGALVVTHEGETGRTELEGPARLVFRGELPSLPARGA